MSEVAEAEYRDALIVEALKRAQESIRLMMMAQRFESHGHQDMAKTTLEIARLNERERIKLWTQIDALDG